MPFVTKVITGFDQVPAGWGRIKEIAANPYEERVLSSAHIAGRLEAVKLMRSIQDRTGPVWVDRAAARRILDTEAARPVAAAPTAPTLAPPSSLDAVLLRLARAAERIAEAQEKSLAFYQAFALEDENFDEPDDLGDSPSTIDMA